MLKHTHFFGQCMLDMCLAYTENTKLALFGGNAYFECQRKNKNKK